MDTISIWDTLDKSGILVGLFTGVVSLMIWIHLLRKEKRDNDLISITLSVTDQAFTATLPGKIRRKNLTRAELQGMLGMLPMKHAGKRYQLGALNDLAFFEGLEQAQVDRDIHEVVIKCDEDDLSQFNKERLEAICVIKQTEK